MRIELQELAIGSVLLALLAVVLNPFGIWMPDMAVAMLLGVFLAVFAAFAAFVWRERAEDEREELHRLLAGRAAFLAGAGVLALGIVIQELAHRLDPWLAFALAAMIAGKIAASAYGRRNR